MRIALALWLLRGAPLPARVLWALEHGCSGVALHEMMMLEQAGPRVEAATLMREHGMSVTYHPNLQSAVAGDDTLDMARVEAVCDEVLAWHGMCGGVRACAIDPLRPNAEGLAAALELNATALRRLAARLQPAGIRVGIENSIGRFGDADELAALAEYAQVPGLGLLLDAGHANVTAHRAGESITAYVQRATLPILEVHLSDNGGAKDDHHALGTGTLDLPALLEALHTKGVATHLTVEVCPNIAAQHYTADIHNPAEIAVMEQSLRVLQGEVVS